MSFKINYNVSAMIANNSLKVNDAKLSTALERLSSGYKINSAKDNAAGLAIARRMNAQIKGLSVAEQGAKDGVSVVEIADGALAEVHDMLQRMNELAVKSSTGTLSDDDRNILNDEIDQLKEEITRISQTTEYNSQKLFDGSFDLKGYVTNNNDLKVNYYTDNVQYGKYDLEITRTPDGAGGYTTTAVLHPESSSVSVPPLIVTEESNQMILRGGKDYEIRLGLKEGWETGIDPVTHKMNLDLDLTGFGAMTLQIGSNEGQTIDLRIPELSLQNMGIENMDLKTKDSASKAIDEIGNAIKFVSEMRSRLGAYQNRLEHTQSNLSTANENMTAAYSRIMDTDMATEMTNYTNLQVVSQAATSILAQANERPSQMLQILQ